MTDFDLTQLHCPLSYTTYKFMPEVGKFSACCHANTYKFDRDLFDLLEDRYFVEHPNLVNRKASLLANIKHQDCEQCWKKEERNIISLRTSKSTIDSPINQSIMRDRDIGTSSSMINRIELWMNSTCNLGCFMCSIGNSSILQKIWRDDPDPNGFTGSGIEKFLQNDPYIVEGYKERFTASMLKLIEATIKDVSTKTLSIAYLGGEPTLQDEMFDHADLFIEWGREAIAAGKRIRIDICTNGTGKPKLNQRFLNMFKKYKAAGWITRVMVSQDGADTYAQVRHGVNFDQVKYNFRTWMRPESEIDEVVSNIVLSSLNFPYIDKMANYLVESLEENYDGNKIVGISFNVLTHPEWMSIKNLPRKYAEKAVNSAIEVLSTVNDKYKKLHIDTHSLQNALSSLSTVVDQAYLEKSFKTMHYVQSIYQKSFDNWNFYDVFDHLIPLTDEYKIKRL